MSDSNRRFGENAQQADSSRGLRRTRPERKPVLRNALIILGTLVALIALAVGIAWAMIANAMSDVHRVSIKQDPVLERPAEVEAIPDEKAPITILLLGSDSRESTDRKVPLEDLRGYRSDAIMVAQLSADRTHLSVMSIMRDNWVDIQGFGEAKINAAFSYGGLPLAVNTVETFIGTRIDHVMLVDFEAFKGITDALGGVTVTNDIAFTAHHGGFEYGAQKITLNGDEALGYVRERYAFVDGDYQRARNQQSYLSGLATQLISSDTLRNPTRLTDSFLALKPYLMLDDGFDLGTAISLGYELRHLRSDGVEFFTSPTKGVGTSADGQSIVLPDWDEIEHMRKAFRDGTVDEYAVAQAERGETK